MTPATHSERETFVAELIRHCPTATARHAQRLMRLAGAYERLLANKTPVSLGRRNARIGRILVNADEIAIQCGARILGHAALHLRVNTDLALKLIPVPGI